MDFSSLLFLPGEMEYDTVQAKVDRHVQAISAYKKKRVARAAWTSNRALRSPSRAPFHSLVYIKGNKLKLHDETPSKRMSHSHWDSCTGGSRIKRSAAVEPQMLPSDQPRMGCQLGWEKRVLPPNHPTSV